MIEALPVDACRVGESPLWHPHEQVLYWCDIPGRALHRWNPASGRHDEWRFSGDAACCAPLEGGDMIVALRAGLVRFDPRTGQCVALADAPYDTATERFNDGKADAHGRFWVGTIYEPRDAARAALYRFAGKCLERIAGDITTSNGLAWSPDGRTMYWSDTKAHVIYALDVGADGEPAQHRRVFARFPAKEPGADAAAYGGRPDGAAMDAEGCYWVAMYEGRRVLRLSPSGELLRVVALPVSCPTMPCFGGPDLRTLFITTAREDRPADELAREPLAGRVLQMRVDVPGLPTHLARL